MNTARWQRQQDNHRLKKLTATPKTRVDDGLTIQCSTLTAYDEMRRKAAAESSISGELVTWPDDLLLDAVAHGLEYFLPAKWHTVDEIYQLAKRELAFRRSKAFKDEHDLWEYEFQNDHWQTLFAIQYPEAS